MLYYFPLTDESIHRDSSVNPVLSKQATQCLVKEKLSIPDCSVLTIQRNLKSNRWHGAFIIWRD